MADPLSLLLPSLELTAATGPRALQEQRERTDSSKADFTTLPKGENSICGKFKGILFLIMWDIVS